MKKTSTSFRALRVALLLSFAVAPAVAQTQPAIPPADPVPLRVFKNLNAGQKQTVVVYGTSLTVTGSWAKSLKDYFDQHFPGQVTFVNAAKSGMHSDWGVENLESRVLKHKPDLVFIEFAVNDAATKNNVSLEKSTANLDTMIQAIRKQNPRADIVLQTMNPAWDAPANKEKKYATDRPQIAAYYDATRRYARTHDLPLIDHEPTWSKLLAEQPERFHAAVPDGIHPNSDASRAITWPAVEAMMEKARVAARK